MLLLIGNELALIKQGAFRLRCFPPFNIHMLKMKIVPQGENLLLVRLGKAHCSCIIGNLKFHDIEPVVSMSIDWIDRGNVTNLQRKKMVKRTINSVLRLAVNHAKHVIGEAKK